MSYGKDEIKTILGRAILGEMDDLRFWSINQIAIMNLLGDEYWTYQELLRKVLIEGMREA